MSMLLDDAQSFIDAHGRTWYVLLDVASLDAIRWLDFDPLTDVFDGDKLPAILSDPVKLAAIVWEMVSADQRGDMTRTEFFSRLRGDSLESAAGAMLLAIADFPPNPAAREGFRQFLDVISGKVQSTMRAVAKVHAKHEDNGRCPE